MSEQHFKKVEDSIKEAAAILRGEKKAAEHWVVNAKTGERISLTNSDVSIKKSGSTLRKNTTSASTKVKKAGIK